MSSAKTEITTTVQKNGPKPYGKIVLTLKNCLLPDEKLLLTPSQNDGLDKETEIDLRIYGCELIQTAGILLKLPQVAMATGQVILQRFYYSKSLVRHPIEHTAMACVCLASKIEEAPRRVRDVINVFYHIRQVNSKKGESTVYGIVVGATGHNAIVSTGLSVQHCSQLILCPPTIYNLKQKYIKQCVIFAFSNRTSALQCVVSIW